MARKSYALAHLDDLQYESAEHRWIASAIARGEMPVESEWSFVQRQAVVAYLDGAYSIHEYVQRKVTRLGDGHVEALVCHVKVDPWKETFKRLFAPRKVRGEGDRERSIEDAAARAKKRVRQACKALGVNSLGTLTYKENVVDRDMAVRHWKAFIRQVRRVLPEFAYVTTIEPQKRGAIHFHFGMRRLPAKVWYVDPASGRGCWVKSWDCMRAIWRRVIAKDGLHGNFDESKRLGRGARARAMRIANYIGKYVAKSFGGGELNRKRYFASGQAPAVVTNDKLYTGDLLEHMVELMTEAAGELLDWSCYWHKGRRLFWFAAHVRSAGGGPS